MANTYFQFKQFRIDQENCAMKVCTDACLFGALAPLENTQRLLDIGAGTGLLALMAAQRSKAEIEAVEIDPQAAKQARINAANSPWSSRIKVFEKSLQEFKPEQAYDFILSNPPFFIGSLKSEAKNEQVAKHATSLSFQEIVNFAAHYLTPAGRLSILLPEYEQQVFAQSAANQNLYPQHRALIRNKTGENAIRVISTYAFYATLISEDELVIRETNGNYSARFRELLKDFYLAL